MNMIGIIGAMEEEVELLKRKNDRYSNCGKSRNEICKG